MSGKRRIAVLILLLVAAAAAGSELPWTQLGPYDVASGTPLGILSVLAVPHTATLYAGGYSGVFRSDDRGGHWSNLGRPGGNEVTLLRADPSDAATVYAATNDGVFKTTDAGATWAPAGLPGLGVSALVLDPQFPNVLYAGTNPVAVDLSGRIYKSSDGGSSWSLLNVAPSGTVLSLAIDPRNSSTVFAGSLEGALLRSTDGGMTWLDSDQLPGAVFEIVIDPARPGSVYARWSDTSYIVWNVPAGALRHSIDGGATWSNVTGLPDRLPGPLLIDPNFPSVFYFEGYGDLYRSVDAGQTWAVMGPTPTYLEPAIAVGDPQYLYVAGDGVLRLDLSLLPPTCDATPTTLCLQYGRFSARVDWRQSPLGPSLQAEAVPVTTDSGYFWFFGPDNVELMVKVLDGTGDQRRLLGLLRRALGRRLHADGDRHADGRVARVRQPAGHARERRRHARISGSRLGHRVEPAAADRARRGAAARRLHSGPGRPLPRAGALPRARGLAEDSARARRSPRPPCR